MLDYIKSQLGDYYKSGGSNICEIGCYRVEVSYKTVLAFENGENIFTMYPWQGITKDEVKQIIADYMETATEVEINTISAFIVSEFELINIIRG